MERHSGSDSWPHNVLSRSLSSFLERSHGEEGCEPLKSLHVIKKISDRSIREIGKRRATLGSEVRGGGEGAGCGKKKREGCQDQDDTMNSSGGFV